MRRNSQAEVGTLLPLLRSRSKARKAAAVAQLCALFEPLVAAQASNYRMAMIGAERDDLEQVARVGLLEACASFNPKKGAKRNAKYGGAFAVHATWKIRHALSEHVANLPNPVRLPSDLAYRLPKLKKAMRVLSQRLERKPTIEELSEAISLSPTAVQQMLNYNGGGIELDRPLHISGAYAYHSGTAEFTVVRDLFKSDLANPEEEMMIHETQRELQRQNNG